MLESLEFDYRHECTNTFFQNKDYERELPKRCTVQTQLFILICQRGKRVRVSSKVMTIVDLAVNNFRLVCSQFPGEDGKADVAII